MIETINIAIVGFGNIGSYFYKVLKKNKKKFNFFNLILLTIKRK